MFYLVLGLIFAAVFIFILWRIIINRALRPYDPETYACPLCDEKNCDCHKRGTPPQT